jgi:hypothetical protein
MKKSIFLWVCLHMGDPDRLVNDIYEDFIGR